MNNSNADELINNCADELNKIKGIIKIIGKFNDQVPYLTKYSLIRSCGTIELAYKAIVADFCEEDAKEQIKFLLDKSFRKKAIDLRYDRICQSLSNFDGNWKDRFKIKMDSLKSKGMWTDSLNSLMVSRNEFAHGGNPTISFGDVEKYFKHAVRVIKILDRIIVT